MSIVGFGGIGGEFWVAILIGGSSAFNLDMLDMSADVSILCSKLSKESGLAGNVIFEGVDVMSNEVGIMADKFAVDCGRGPFKVVAAVDIAGHVDMEVVDVTEAKDIVLEAIVLTLGNSFKFISTKSSYKL
jgi:hypothetical protein